LPSAAAWRRRREGKEVEGERVLEVLLSLSMAEEDGRVDDEIRRAKAATGSKQRTPRARKQDMASAGACVCPCVRGGGMGGLLAGTWKGLLGSFVALLRCWLPGKHTRPGFFMRMPAECVCMGGKCVW